MKRGDAGDVLGHRLRVAEVATQLVLDPADRLGGAPDRQLVAAPLRHQAVRLQADVGDDVAAVGALDHRRGLLQSFIDVLATLVHLALLGDGLAELEAVLLARDVVQLLVLHLDRADGVLGDRFGRRRHRRDLVARVVELVSRLLDEVHRLDPLHALGGAQVDRDDLRMREGAPEHPGVEESGEVDVVRVLRAPRDLQLPVQAGHGGPNEPALLGPLCHVLSLPSASACSRTHASRRRRTPM
jgi:hypothetical protein